MYIRYHHDEWGVSVFDDQKQFEFLVLESAQTGLVNDHVKNCFRWEECQEMK